MKKFTKWLKRKWVFGLPVWLYCLFGLVLIGAAAFSALQSPTLSLTAKDLNAGFGDPVCSVIGAGAISECTATAITGSGFDDSSSIHLDIIAFNDDTVIDYNMTFTVTPPAGVNAVTCVLPEPPWNGADCDGATIANSTGGFAVDIDVDLNDLVASQVVDPFVYTIQMSE